MEYNKDINQNEFSLVSNITVCESDNLIFNKNKIIEKYEILQEKDSFLILKNRNGQTSFAMSYNQSEISEDEFQIFKAEIKPDKIKLSNPIEMCEKYLKKQEFYDAFNDIDFKLWKAIQKCPDGKNIDENNKDLYSYYLQENDVFRLGDIKFIVREFNNINNEDNIKEKENNKNIIFTMKIKSILNKSCSICDKSDFDLDNPIIALCNCEEYYHFKCKKNIEMNQRISKISDNCTRYSLERNCVRCKKFIPVSFFVEQRNEDNKKKEYKFFELIDIPKNKKENYLLLETLYFLDYEKIYRKYIFYIELGKKEKTILIGRKPSSSHNIKYNNIHDELLLIGNTGKISKEHALIIYNAKENNLILRNVSESQNTLILKNELELSPNDKEILFEFRNLQIKARLIYNNDEQFQDIKDKMVKDEIEIREIL